jgi:hypothetical protein
MFAGGEFIRDTYWWTGAHPLLLGLTSFLHLLRLHTGGKHRTRIEEPIIGSFQQEVLAEKQTKLF